MNKRMDVYPRPPLLDGDVIYPENTCLPPPSTHTCGDIGANCESNQQCCDDEICADGVCGGPDGGAVYSHAHVFAQLKV